MSLILILIFVLGYFLIALEHSLKIDKAGSSLVTGVLCWIVLMIGIHDMPVFADGLNQIPSNISNYLNVKLFEHLGSIAGILFFLLAAMAIVELIDAYEGFNIITQKINTKSFVKLIWILSFISFISSACLDNLTTAIIMCALVRKLTSDKENQWLLGGFVIIAANAGGAWSPIGDVTTIMLWIGGHVSTLNIMKTTFLSSLVSLLVPLLLVSWFKRSKTISSQRIIPDENKNTNLFERNLMFILGCLALLSVPAFKYFTSYPPFMGILLSVGVLWFVTEFLHRGKPDEDTKRNQLSVGTMLRRIDSPSILFFLGILLAVASLEESGHLHLLSTYIDKNFGNIYITNTLIGLLSAIVDNVPLVAAAMGMYENAFPMDHDFWNLLAYCAGTGGSILIIGSAAGVASMGILHIDFIWYLKRISLYALIGYLAGIACYALEHG